MKVRKDTKLIDYIIHGIFFTVYGLVKYFPRPLGDYLRYIVVKPFIKKIGKVRISEGVTIYYPNRIIIEDGVRLNEFSFLQGYGGIIMKKHSGLGVGAKLISSDHIVIKDQPLTETGLLSGQIVIQEYASIGANAIIMRGVVVGKNSFVGANALVKNNVPENTMVGGVPAKVIKHIE